MSKNLMLGVKLFVSVALLYLLLDNVGWAEMLDSILSIDRALAGLTFFILFIQFPISNLKWQLILRQFKLFYRFSYLHVVICIGFFFNNFLPTSIGGDVYRVLKTTPEEGGRARPIAVVLVDRIVGMLALLILGYIAAWVLYFSSDIRFLVYLPHLTVLGLLILAGLFLLPAKIWLALKTHPKLQPVMDNLTLLLSPSRELPWFITISIVFQVLAVVAMLSLFQAAGSTIGFWHCALIAASSGVVTMLPISINGIGVMEGAIVMVAVLLGADVGDASVVAVVLRLMTLVLSGMCGVVFFAANIFSLPTAHRV